MTCTPLASTGTPAAWLVLIALLLLGGGAALLLMSRRRDRRPGARMATFAISAMLLSLVGLGLSGQQPASADASCPPTAPATTSSSTPGPSATNDTTAGTTSAAPTTSTEVGDNSSTISTTSSTSDSSGSTDSSSSTDLTPSSTTSPSTGTTTTTTTTTTTVTDPPDEPLDFAPLLLLNPSVVNGSASASLTVTIENLSVPASSSPVVIRVPKDVHVTGVSLSGTDWTLDAATDPLNYVLTYSGTIAGAASSGPGVLAFTWDSGITSGVHNFVGTIDTGSGGDSNAANNSDTQSLTYSALLPDLVVEQVVGNEAPMSRADVRNFAVTVQNIGLGSTNGTPIVVAVPDPNDALAGGNIDVAFDGAASSVLIDGSSYPVDQTLISMSHAGPGQPYLFTFDPAVQLTAGATRTFAFSMTYTATAQADDGSTKVFTTRVQDGSGGETNFTNNSNSDGLYVFDLYLSMDRIVAEGVYPHVALTVKNDGSVPRSVDTGAAVVTVTLSEPSNTFDDTGHAGGDCGMGTWFYSSIQTSTQTVIPNAAGGFTLGAGDALGTPCETTVINDIAIDQYWAGTGVNPLPARTGTITFLLEYTVISDPTVTRTQTVVMPWLIGP